MNFINSIKNWFHKTFSSSNSSENTNTQNSSSKPVTIVCYPNGSVKPLSQVEQSSNDDTKKSA